jgi:hypothetical protein
MEMPLLDPPPLDVAISGLPSLLKSPTTTEFGNVPTGKLVAELKVDMINLPIN